DTTGSSEAGAPSGVARCARFASPSAAMAPGLLVAVPARPGPGAIAAGPGGDRSWCGVSRAAAARGSRARTIRSRRGRARRCNGPRPPRREGEAANDGRRSASVSRRARPPWGSAPDHARQEAGAAQLDAGVEALEAIEQRERLALRLGAEAETPRVLERELQALFERAQGAEVDGDQRVGRTRTGAAQGAALGHVEAGRVRRPRVGGAPSGGAARPGRGAGPARS